MTGPALKKVDSHSSIHEAALGEAEQLTDLLEVLLRKNERDKAYDAACIALEHWETRTLAHAGVEEEELYKEIEKKHPELKEKIVSLTRDHELMRRLAGEIRHLLANGEVNEEVLNRFRAIILIDMLHNRDEMQLVESIEGVR